MCCHKGIACILDFCTSTFHRFCRVIICSQLLLFPSDICLAQMCCLNLLCMLQWLMINLFCHVEAVHCLPYGWPEVPVKCLMCVSVCLAALAVCGSCANMCIAGSLCRLCFAKAAGCMLLALPVAGCLQCTPVQPLAVTDWVHRCPYLLRSLINHCCA